MVGLLIILLNFSIIFDILIYFTAAHCIISKNAADFHVLLGRFNNTDANEKNWQRRNISETFVYENYNATANYYLSNGDVSILKVTQAIEYTDFIQPVCLPKVTTITVGVHGIVVGYGQNQAIGNAQNTPSYIALKSIRSWDCLAINQQYHSIVSENSFCAGDENHEGSPCKGKFLIIYLTY